MPDIGSKSGVASIIALIVIGLAVIIIPYLLFTTISKYRKLKTDAGLQEFNAVSFCRRALLLLVFSGMNLAFTLLFWMMEDVTKDSTNNLILFIRLFCLLNYLCAIIGTILYPIVFAVRGLTGLRWCKIQKNNMDDYAQLSKKYVRRVGMFCLIAAVVWTALTVIYFTIMI